jgi:hypothetical protein
VKKKGRKKGEEGRKMKKEGRKEGRKEGEEGRKVKKEGR